MLCRRMTQARCSIHAKRCLTTSGYPRGMKIQTALADTSYQAAPGSGFACARQLRTAPHLTIPALQIASTSTETASVSSEAHDPCEHLLRKHTQQKHMASNNPSSNLERAAEAADDFEKKHYQGGELDAQDFKKAGENATAAVSNAATAVKEAVVGPADPKVCLSTIVRNRQRSRWYVRGVRDAPVADTFRSAHGLAAHVS
jgi:hypothetical protein